MIHTPSNLTAILAALRKQGKRWYNRSLRHPCRCSAFVAGTVAAANLASDLCHGGSLRGPCPQGRPLPSQVRLPRHRGPAGRPWPLPIPFFFRRRLRQGYFEIGAFFFALIL